MSKNILPESKFDVRVLQHRLRRGDITREQYDAFLAQLPDESAEGVETETRFAAPFAQRGAATRGSGASNAG